MSVLTANQRRQLAEHIAERLQQLDGEIAHLTVLTKPVSPDRSIGRLSRLEALNELAVNEKALISARTRHTRLLAIQGQVQAPEYGCCSFCDEPIPFARLLSIPESKLCVACAEQAGY